MKRILTEDYKIDIQEGEHRSNTIEAAGAANREVLFERRNMNLLGEREYDICLRFAKKKEI